MSLLELFDIILEGLTLQDGLFGLRNHLTQQIRDMEQLKLILSVECRQ